jgi:caffeoyl-CoA O-methyltransferase
VTFGIVDPDVEAYAEAHTTREPEHLTALAEVTRKASQFPQMMVGPLEGQFLAMLVHAIRPSVVLEIGTFTGYSSLSMAAALPPGGRIITCDISPEHLAIARQHIAASAYADRIDVREGPALGTIAALDEAFDFVFIDADKDNYTNYLDAVLPKLASTGLIAADNTLWSGRVVDPAADDDQTAAIRAFNDRVASDPNLICAQLTVRDGITLIRHG